MAIEVKVPAVGESVQEGMIQSWHKNDGDSVEMDEVLLDLETDKATVEVVAAASGVLKITVPAGKVVKVGSVIGSIDPDAKGGKKSEAKESKKESKESKDEKKEEKETKKEEKEPKEKKESKDEKKEEKESKKGEEKSPGPAGRSALLQHDLKASDVSGSGKDGRVTKEDVKKHVDEKKDKGEAKPTPKMPPSEKAGREREDSRKPMSMMRRRIAERLLASQQNAAILTTFNEVDMTEILAMRSKYQDAFTKRYGVKLGFMGFFLKASVAALKEYEAVNAYIDGQDLVYHNYCDIGVAVSTDKGLIVPIIRDVDQMSLAEIELAIGGFAEKARANKIKLEDLSGGTFTVSNGGIFGSLLSTPILNPPQSAILGMHKTEQRPRVMQDGSIVARPMMYLALSYDHRIIDGKEAVGFLVKIKENLEDPSRLVLGV